MKSHRIMTSHFKFQGLPPSTRAGMRRSHIMSSAYRLGALIIMFCVILPGECLAGESITAAIDQQLLGLIDQYAPSFFNPSWNLNTNQFKAWVATIAWAEGGNGGYGAHSGGALGTDIFYHAVLGSAFKFSTGLGPFQLDNDQSPENWQNWPTIDKLTLSLSVQSILRWHQDHRTAAGSTLADFAANSPWVAVRTPSTPTQWAAVTGTSWDTYKNGNVTLDWSAVEHHG